jgi:hypothetical protein
MFDDLKMFVRYGLGLRHFLKTPLTLEEGRRRIAGNLQNRERLLLRLIEKGVFENPASPYRKLLYHAGVEFGDLVKGVHEDGVEATLHKLYGEGVYLSYDEFKCRTPIQRGNLSFVVRPKDFDNPFLAQHYEVTTGGSRGVGTRVIVDFEIMANDAAYHNLLEDEFATIHHPLALWRPLPPAVAGIYRALRMAKVGRPIEKWFTHNKFRPTLATAHYYLFSAVAIYGSRFSRNPLPFPEFVPLDNVRLILRWLEEKKKAGRSGVIFTQTTSAVRVCRAALETKNDISGSVFFVGGEPYTAAKAEILTQAGCRGVPIYAMTELGDVGEPCPYPRVLDDFHFLEDKLALVQQSKPIANSGLSVGAFFYTTLLSSSPKLLLNVDCGDYGTLERRDCGCSLGELGLRTHIGEIRSYDKLTSEGMTFFGSELMRLTDHVLPRKFGGYPSDYQFVEKEEDGIPRVQIRVSPRIGRLDEPALVAVVLSTLRSYPGAKKLMADRWRDARTLRVVRSEPVATMAGKTLPLHILSKAKRKTE